MTQVAESTSELGQDDRRPSIVRVKRTCNLKELHCRSGLVTAEPLGVIGRFRLNAKPRTAEHQLSRDDYGAVVLRIQSPDDAHRPHRTRLSDSAGCMLRVAAHPGSRRCSKVPSVGPSSPRNPPIAHILARDSPVTRS